MQGGVVRERRDLRLRKLQITSSFEPSRALSVTTTSQFPLVVLLSMALLRMSVARVLAWLASGLLWQTVLCQASTTPPVHDAEYDVTYEGICDGGIETFLSIPYGKDTGGNNRFRPPQPYVHARGSTFTAQGQGPACPQPSGAIFFPLYLSNITSISEDCLHLNVYRAAGTAPDAKLPVMVYIHGGGFYAGSKDEITIQPGGLILDSVNMGHPVVVVNINYRVGIFGFAQSKALEQEGSENAGLRDQRLAIEWTRDNIGSFGGDPEHITILGQSSGGLAVGLQIMAYGGSQPVPFQQASCESQALEPGITGNFTIEAMDDVTQYVGCDTSNLQSPETIACLRALSTEALQLAQETTHRDGPGANIGDQWLPVVDGDFLPEAPSKLIADGGFANVTTMIGWCEDDGTLFVGSPKTDEDVFDYFTGYLPGMTTTNIRKLLSLYPVSDFSANPSADLSAQFYRAARILRDILFTCQPIHYGRAIYNAGNDVYLWDQNQTFVDEILASSGQPGYGVVHTSSFAYQFGNLSHYDINGLPYNPTKADFALRDKQSRSWAAFANFGRPSLPRYNTLQGWQPAFADDGDLDIYVIGGPHAGLSAIGGPQSDPAVAAQRLKKRCAFINSPEIIEQLQY
ncbi:hypothetical protein LTR37_019644 [Vermiconidia calcicola]|uniref:Uncharacterized protein n=1 Tax=Vermiconidia calcicola TaxID=1690605 RepID=A0ACC3MFE5_9PEZI|nr:hypothetical protein LTR37_019644 [Vermiconidia calcicola]